MGDQCGARLARLEPLDRSGGPSSCREPYRRMGSVFCPTCGNLLLGEGRALTGALSGLRVVLRLAMRAPDLRVALPSLSSPFAHWRPGSESPGRGVASSVQPHECLENSRRGSARNRLTPPPLSQRRCHSSPRSRKRKRREPVRLLHLPLRVLHRPQGTLRAHGPSQRDCRGRVAGGRRCPAAGCCRRCGCLPSRVSIFGTPASLLLPICRSQSPSLSSGRR